MKQWLMKAEPDPRVVKGKDVKFSVDDFEEVKTSPWEGVRNAEARNIMKEMTVGDQVLFYHSNCKNPGIAAFAEVTKEAYPDHTAWDSSHPYYDAKTNPDNPKWYMVDVMFKSRAKHFVPLSLLRRIAAASSDPPADVAYIGKDGVSAIKEMALVARGRLSVQRVEERTWDVILALSEEGGWDEGSNKSGGSEKASKKGKAKSTKAKASDKLELERKVMDDEQNPRIEAAKTVSRNFEEHEPADGAKVKGSRKRKAIDDNGDAAPLRRSSRTRK